MSVPKPGWDPRSCGETEKFIMLRRGRSFATRSVTIEVFNDGLRISNSRKGGTTCGITTLISGAKEIEAGEIGDATSKRKYRYCSA
jgi:hypothetical protein